MSSDRHPPDPQILLDLYHACMKLRPFLKASIDPLKWPHRAGSRAEQLRDEADRIEAEDEAIMALRRALKATHHALGKSAEGIEWHLDHDITGGSAAR
jgi:hypothetical protein